MVTGNKIAFFNTPVMFTEEEKAGESSSLWFTYLAIIIIELGQAGIHRELIWLAVDITFRFF
jgi:hypothetical protein